MLLSGEALRWAKKISSFCYLAKERGSQLFPIAIYLIYLKIRGYNRLIGKQLSELNLGRVIQG